MEDLFPEFAPMSTSQEELLQRKRFDPDPFPEISSRYQHHYDDATANVIPTTNIFMVDIQGVLHAPGTQETETVANCSFNTADYETLELMDSNLGFPEYLPSLADMDCDYDDEVRVSEPQNSDLGEPPHKKMKSLEMNAQDEQMNVDDDDDDDDDDICTEIPRRTEKEKKYFVFDVLRVLANARAAEEEKKKKRTLLEAAMSRGITYTRPKHWSKNRKSQFFKFHDEVKE